MLWMNQVSTVYYNYLNLNMSIITVYRHPQTDGQIPKHATWQHSARSFEIFKENMLFRMIQYRYILNII